MEQQSTRQPNQQRPLHDGPDELATKRDLRELELHLEAKLAETKADIIRWTIGAGIFRLP